jgi:hypothetical protein
MKVCLLLFVLLGPALLHADEVWEFEVKALTLDANEGCAVADVNKDGHMDVVAGRNWYAGPDFLPRPLRSIEDWNGYVESNGDYVYDVNKDGWPDVIAGSFIPSEVYWYENPGEGPLRLGQMWKQHLLQDTGFGQNEGSFLYDLTGDGVPEWISNSWNKQNPLVVWTLGTEMRTVKSKVGKMEVEKDMKVPALVKHVVGAEGNGHGMGFGDINNDGREDITFANGWYERPEGDPFAQAWKYHADWDNLHASVPMIIRDVDADGKNDIIWGKGHDFGLFLWKSKGMANGKTQWEEILIDKSYSQPHTPGMVDLDGDGVEELVSGKRVRAHNGKDPGGMEPPCLYVYQWQKADGRFKRFVVNEGLVGTGLQLAHADLNGDGKTDLAVAGKSGTYVLFNKR